MRLLDHTELLGPAQGSGLREPPHLVRRPDGEVVALSPVLYTLARHLDGRDLQQVADTAGRELGLRLTAEHVRHLADTRLFPVGLTVRSDGAVPSLQRVDPILALRHRVGVIGQGPVIAAASVLSALFAPVIVVLVVLGLVAVDVWLLAVHGLGQAVGTLIDHPALGLAVFAVTVASLAFHELGHAAACRHGGARPGRIGIGFYLIWPVFFTDVTDSWRLGRAGRLRTDLGGVYFNALVALAAAAGYTATGYEPLLLVIAAQQLLMLDQFLPWVRLDGYHVVSDLIGVGDLFTRIRPILRSLIPGRPPERAVSDLKPWARAAVTAWVITTMIALAGALTIIALHGPRYLTRAWTSLTLQIDTIAAGSPIADTAAGVIGVAMLLMPIAGLLLTYLVLCHRIGARLALRQARHHAEEKLPHPPTTNMPAGPPHSREPLMQHHNHPPPEGADRCVT
jgi:putative peptide zinc metalloprotease protein